MSRKTTPTYVLLNQITLAATSSSVTFSNIPQNYGDLVVSGTTNIGTGALLASINGSNANLSRVRMLNNGETPFSDFNNDNNMGDTFGSGQVTFCWQLFDYSTTDKHKTNLIRVGSASGRVFAHAQRWAETTAINSVSIGTNQSFSVGTTFSIYGVHA